LLQFVFRLSFQGTARAQKSHRHKNFLEIEVEINSVKNVEEYENFLKKDKNESITIFVSQQALTENKIEQGKKDNMPSTINSPTPKNIHQSKICASAVDVRASSLKICSTLSTFPLYHSFASSSSCAS
jgi:hypothetical protein